jgi:hypothetical protein
MDEFGQVLNAAGFIPAQRKATWCLSLDIGQAADPSAITVMERAEEPKLFTGEGEECDLIQRLDPPQYYVRHLQRLPLQMPYPQQVNFVASLMQREPLKSSGAKLILDATGVGRAVADMFRPMNPVNVVITGGMGERRDWDNGGYYHVAKIQLVSGLQALLNNGALHISAKLPEAVTLVNELGNFRANISDTGVTTFGARSGQHDDLVLSLALACWWLIGPRSAGSRMTVQPLEL